MIGLLFTGKRKAAALAAVLLLGILIGAQAAAEAVSRNPLLTPVEIMEYTQTPDEIFNVLILGIDYGGDVYKSSAKRHALEEGHTDAVMVVSVNLSKKTLSLISLSRDSLTYVPGVRGIYKLNAAINCGETIEEGLKLACDAVSWHLGGVRIDKYVAVDADAMVALGDAIGGIDFELDVSFETAKRYYKRGMQHLDGEGILGYMRARRNASSGQTDLARVDRQRRLIKALFEKIASEPALIKDLLGVVTGGEENIFMNVDLADMLKLAPMALSIDFDNVKTYSLTGSIKTFMKNFTFNDPDVRAQVVNEVFGIEMEPLEYVSYEYSLWLTRHGLTAAKFINNAKAIMDYAKAAQGAAQAQLDELAQLEAAYDAAIAAFDTAADSQLAEDNDALNDACEALKRAARAVDGSYEYPERIKWERTDYWYMDDMINEKILNWN